MRRKGGDEEELSLQERRERCACQLWGCILPHTGVHAADVHASIYPFIYFNLLLYFHAHRKRTKMCVSNIG